MWSLLADLAPTIVPIIILYFELIGLFGNINIIVATIRKEHLQTKHGVLLALTSFYQLMCLLGELVNVTFALTVTEIRRNMCFVFMSPYLVFSCLQSTMFLVLALDILISILFPLKHMVARLPIYVFIASIPAIAYAVLILSMAVEAMISTNSNPRILLCNPPLSMDPRVTHFWINFNGFSNLGVLIVYVAVYIVVSNRDKHQQKLGRCMKQTAERKVLISLLWLITVFASTWCTCMLTLVIVTWMEPTMAVAVIQSYVVVFALMAYSANYYVYFTKNQAYRRVFLEQLEWIFPRRFFAGELWNETRSQISCPQTVQIRSTPGTDYVDTGIRSKHWKVGSNTSMFAPRRF